MGKMQGGKHALWCALIVGMAAAGPGYANDPLFDVVIEHGRVMDPESGLDGVRNIGIAQGVIGLITDRALNGKRTIDATEIGRASCRERV